jgi:hypothetical protein
MKFYYGCLPNRIAGKKNPSIELSGHSKKVYAQTAILNLAGLGVDLGYASKELAYQTYIPKQSKGKYNRVKSPLRVLRAQPIGPLPG